MAETLLSGSAILMYGREMTDITLDQGTYLETTSVLNHLQKQLCKAIDDDTKSRLARIYAIGYCGDVYTLATPTIFLVQGEGRPAEPGNAAAKPPRRASMRPAASTDDTGVALQDYTFTDDIKVWTYDKNDISLRLDLSTGTLEDILLAAEFGDDMDFPSFGGGKVGGGKVGGGKVGGGKVGGG